MLKEAADDGADADVFAEAFDSGTEGADAADDEIDLDSGLRGSVERFDDADLEQRVHFGDDVGGASGFGVFSFALDEADEAFGESQRGDEQGSVGARLGVRGEVVEDRLHAGGDFGTAVRRLMSV